MGTRCRVGWTTLALAMTRMMTLTVVLTLVQMQAWLLMPGGVRAALAATPGMTLMAKDKSKQDAGPTPAAILEQSLTPETVDDLLAKLTDAQVRAVLDESLRRQAEAHVAKTAAPPSVEERLVAAGSTVKERLHGMARALPHLGQAVEQAVEVLAGPQGAGGLALHCGGVALLLLLAWRVERLAARQLLRVRHHAASDEEMSQQLPRFRQHLVALAGRVTGLLVFALTALAGYALLYNPAWPSRPLTTGLLAAGGSARLAWVLLHWLIAPAPAARMRPLPLGDDAARIMFRLIMTLLVLGILRLQVLRALAVAGMDPASLVLLRGIVGLAGLGLLIGVVLAQRRRVAAWILSLGGESPGPLRRQFAAVWHLLALVYMLCLAAVWYALLLLEGAEGPQGVLSAGLLAVPAFALLDRGGRFLLRRVFAMFQRRPSDTATLPKLDEDGQPMGEATVVKAEPLPDVETMRLFAPARAWVRLALLLFVGAAMWEAWGVGTDWTHAIMVHGFRILLVLGASLAIWEAAKAGIQRSLQPPTASELDNPRVNTLLPLLQKVLGVFLLLSTTLMILSQLGMEIGPLLASAGVFGLAIGMGSQTLVKDVVAGVFFLLDDAFRVGDYIQMGKTEGYVIKMSVRNITMQHTLGYVQILPFGQIKDVVNYSRNPIIMKIKIPMPLETDPKVFKKICKKVNESIMADEEFKDDLVEPIKSQGVKRIEDSTLIFGIKYMTKPGKQFSIRREVYSRLYKEFKKKGLTFAAPGVTVYTSGPTGDGVEAAAASAAARAKAQAQQQVAEGGDGA